MNEFTSYQTLIQSLDVAVIITDLESRVEVWNPAAERTYGWKSSEVLGKNLGEFLPTKFERLEEDAESARGILLKTGVWRGTVIQNHKDGKPINIESLVCLLKDEQGQPEKMAAINRDITEEKRQSEALLQTIDRLIP